MKILFLFLFLSLLHNCATTPSSKKAKKKKIFIETIEEQPVITKQNEENEIIAPPKMVKTDTVLNFLKTSTSIKILTYSIESPDFATQLLREKLAGKDIDVLISKHSLQNYRSKINYLKEIDLIPTLINFPPQLEGESFIIIDNTQVIKNIFIAINQTDNSETGAFLIGKELAVWNSCKTSPDDCYVNFSSIFPKSNETKKNQTSETIKKTSWVLPTKTKKEKFMESESN